MVLHEIVDPLSGSITYIIYDEAKGCAIAIDANNFTLIDSFIAEKNLKLEYIILTHEHYDHVLAAQELQKKYNSQIIASKECAEELIINSKKLARDYSVYVNIRNKEKTNTKFCLDKIVVDTQFEHNMVLCWYDNKVELFEVNGHSKGSICIIFNQQYLFSGDNLLKNRTLISEFVGSNKNIYLTKTLDFFRALDDKLIVLPGHGECFKLSEKTFEE